MGNYCFMYLNVTILDRIRKSIPDEIVAILNTWRFDQIYDRQNNPYEVLDVEDILPNLNYLKNEWRTQLGETNISDDPAWDEFNRFQNLLSYLDRSVAPRSRNGMGRRVFLVKNPPSNNEPIRLPRPQD